jgi:hypothetical protein
LTNNKENEKKSLYITLELNNWTAVVHTVVKCKQIMHCFGLWLEVR